MRRARLSWWRPLYLQALAIILIALIVKVEPVLFAVLRIVRIHLVDKVEAIAAQLHEGDRRAKMFT